MAIDYEGCPLVLSSSTPNTCPPSVFFKRIKRTIFALKSKIADGTIALENTAGLLQPYDVEGTWTPLVAAGDVSFSPNNGAYVYTPGDANLTNEGTTQVRDIGRSLDTLVIDFENLETGDTAWGGLATAQFFANQSQISVLFVLDDGDLIHDGTPAILDVPQWIPANLTVFEGTTDSNDPTAPSIKKLQLHFKAGTYELFLKIVGEAFFNTIS